MSLEVTALKHVHGGQCTLTYQPPHALINKQARTPDLAHASLAPTA